MQRSWKKSGPAPESGFWTHGFVVCFYIWWSSSAGNTFPVTSLHDSLISCSTKGAWKVLKTSLHLSLGLRWLCVDESAMKAQPLCEAALAQREISSLKIPWKQTRKKIWGLRRVLTFRLPSNTPSKFWTWEVLRSHWGDGCYCCHEGKSQYLRCWIRWGSVTNAYSCTPATRMGWLT